MKEFTVKIKSLTPLWTGDADRKNTTLRETGIIGSLRWWYEALIRGLGGTACDPTDTKCEGKNHCDACELFGCTGWARKFKLEINANGNEFFPLFFTTTIDGNKWWLKKIWNNKSGIKLKFTILRGDDDIEKIMNLILYIIGKYSGLGAKPQYGFGQVKVMETTKEMAKEGMKVLLNSIHERNHSNNFPDFSDFFFFKFRIPSNNVVLNSFKNSKKIVGKLPKEWDWKFVPCAFDIRYKGEIDNKICGLRKYFREKYGKKIAQKIFGYSFPKDKRMGCNIFISHPYRENNDENYSFKAYGFLPKNNFLEYTEEIKKCLTNIFEVGPAEEKTGKEILGELK